MYRTSQRHLTEWSQRHDRKPLVVRGARQVGKSTLVRQFAAAQGLTLWEINLEQHHELAPAFASLDAATILRDVGLALNRPGVGQGPGVLFLDEIQAIPQALSALRYLYEQRPQLPVIAAGSLLEFTLADAAISMPVGRVEYHFLGPMTFEEFLLARGEDLLAQSLEGQSHEQSFSPAAHERLNSLLREYLLVGGMPEAVAAYGAVGDFAAASRVHRSILSTYADDFGKYTKGIDRDRIRRIFEVLPTQLAQKVRFNRFHPDWRAADIRRCLELLIAAQVASSVTHVDASGVPLGAEEDPTVFKLFHLDVGLAANASGSGQLSLADFQSGRFVNEGVLAEQFVAQQLLSTQPPDQKPRLHYWQRGGSSSNAEVDFICAHGREVLPIEVKAGASGALRSLHQFMLKHPGKTALRFDLNPVGVQQVQTDVQTAAGPKSVHYRLMNLPLYVASSTLLSGLNL